MICRAFISAAMRAALRAYSQTSGRWRCRYKAAVMGDAVGDGGHPELAHAVVDIVPGRIFF
jgi:hypothetical protein